MPKQWTPRRIRDEEDRGSGSSDYISLDDGESFVGHALFEADPKVDDPAYYEYAEHWYTGGQGRGSSVPCAGDDCPLCEDGDKPRTRAKTVWLVSRDAKKSVIDPPKLMIFNFNYNIIKQFTDLRSEDEKIKGREFRIARLDDRGNYSVTPKTDTMTATAVKAAIKDKAMPDLDGIVTSQLRKAMEGMAVKAAVEDAEEEDAPRGRSNGQADKPAGKRAKKAQEAAEWPAELEDAEVVVEEIDDDGNYVVISSEEYDDNANLYCTDDTVMDFTELTVGTILTVTAEADEAGDYILSAEPEAQEGEEPEPEPDNDLPDSIEEEEFEVVSVDADESIIEVENEDYKFLLYFLDSGPASKVDFEDYEPGAKIIVSAEKDSSGDLVATVVPEIKKAKRAASTKKTTTASRKSTTARKSGTAKRKTAASTTRKKTGTARRK